MKFKIVVFVKFCCKEGFFEIFNIKELNIELILILVLVNLIVVNLVFINFVDCNNIINL